MLSNVVKLTREFMQLRHLLCLSNVSDRKLMVATPTFSWYLTRIGNLSPEVSSLLLFFACMHEALDCYVQLCHWPLHVYIATTNVMSSKAVFTSSMTWLSAV